jgi:predicted CopG family antitoxin
MRVLSISILILFFLQNPYFLSILLSILFGGFRLPSRQVSVKKEVKDKLESLKLEGESITDVIQRLLENLELSSFGGLLKDLPEEHKKPIRSILYRRDEGETS